MAIAIVKILPTVRTLKRALLSVNLTSNPVRECCLTIGSRSPLAPLKKGSRGWDKIPIKVPLLKGDLGGSRLD